MMSMRSSRCSSMLLLPLLVTFFLSILSVHSAKHPEYYVVFKNDAVNATECSAAVTVIEDYLYLIYVEELLEKTHLKDNEVVQIDPLLLQNSAFVAQHPQFQNEYDQIQNDARRNLRSGSKDATIVASANNSGEDKRRRLINTCSQLCLDADRYQIQIRLRGCRCVQRRIKEEEAEEEEETPEAPDNTCSTLCSDPVRYQIQIRLKGCKCHVRRLEEEAEEQGEEEIPAEQGEEETPTEQQNTCSMLCLDPVRYQINIRQKGCKCNYVRRLEESVSSAKRRLNDKPTDPKNDCKTLCKDPVRWQVQIRLRGCRCTRRRLEEEEEAVSSNSNDEERLLQTTMQNDALYQTGNASSIAPGPGYKVAQAWYTYVLNNVPTAGNCQAKMYNATYEVWEYYSDSL